MIIEVIKAHVEPALGGLENVVTRATVLLKEFDDSAVDYVANPETEKPVVLKRTYLLKEPSNDSFVDISSIDKDVVLQWVNQLPLADKRIEEPFNKHVEQVKAQKLKRQTVKEHLNKGKEAYQNSRPATASEPKPYEITF